MLVPKKLSPEQVKALKAGNRILYRVEVNGEFIEANVTMIRPLRRAEKRES